MTENQKLREVLHAAHQTGCAHNNGAGGQYLICATEAQLLAFAQALALPTADTDGNVQIQTGPNSWIGVSADLAPSVREALGAETAAPVGEREAHVKWCFDLGLMSESFGIRSVNSVCDTTWLAFQAGAAYARAALAGDADGRRYRLVRRGQHWSVINGIGDVLRADALDAAVDEAMARGGE